MSVSLLFAADAIYARRSSRAALSLAHSERTPARCFAERTGLTDCHRPAATKSRPAEPCAGPRTQHNIVSSFLPVAGCVVDSPNGTGCKLSSVRCAECTHGVTAGNKAGPAVDCGPSRRRSRTKSSDEIVQPKKKRPDTSLSIATNATVAVLYLDLCF